MNILEKLDRYDKEERLNESGIRNINKWAKKFKKAVCYFHVDLDGVTSALAMKTYLEQYGIKTVKAHKIQYGGLEFAVKKAPKQGTLVYAVDFAHSKPSFHIWTDHHDSEHIGATKEMSTSFVKAPANVTHISMTISPRDIFPNKDLEIISTVDSADFYRQGLTPDDIMRAVYITNKDIPVKKNHQMMGFATNKLILSYKNKEGFLEDVVMNAKPSLISIYNTVTKLAKAAGYKPPEEIETHQGAYNAQQAKAAQGQGKISDIKTIKSGQSVMIDNIVVQYGGGSMSRGKQYDRYTVFKVNPDADYLIIIWAMGLVQVTKNPFKVAASDVHLGDLALKGVMKKYKPMFSSKMVPLDNIKRMYERDVTKKKLEGSMGFTFDDLINTFKPSQVQGIDLEKTGKWKDIIKDISGKNWKDLSYKQKQVLGKVSVSVWDIVMSQSGGHPSITNITNLDFLGKGYTETLRDIAVDIAKALKKL